MPELDDQTRDLVAGMLLMAGLLVVVAIGIQVIAALRRRLTGRSGSSEAEMADAFREAFEAGEMSAEEYHKVREAMGRRPSTPPPRVAPTPAAPPAADATGPEAKGGMDDSRPPDPASPGSDMRRPRGIAATLVEPWQEIATPSQADALAAELRRELTAGHPLHGLPVRAIARRPDSEEVIFSVEDGSGRVAVVHLTWRGGPESLPWPSSALYADLEAWASAGRRDDA